MQVADDPISPLPAQKSGSITFGCLNNFCKVNDGVLEFWARVLREVPDSRLMLLVPPGVRGERVAGEVAGARGSIWCGCNLCSGSRGRNI